jgi:hypothetical protein
MSCCWAFAWLPIVAGVVCGLLRTLATVSAALVCGGVVCRLAALVVTEGRPKRRGCALDCCCAAVRPCFCPRCAFVCRLFGKDSIVGALGLLVLWGLRSR